MAFNFDNDVMTLIGESVIRRRIKVNLIGFDWPNRWGDGLGHDLYFARLGSMDKAKERIAADQSIPRGFKGSVKENLAFSYRLFHTRSQPIPGGFVTGNDYGPVAYDAYNGGRRKPINYTLMDK